MKVRCRTNLDNFSTMGWPDEMCCRPEKGDEVRASNGVILYVVNITHTVYNIHEFESDVSPVWRPMLLIELHNRQTSFSCTKN